MNMSVFFLNLIYHSNLKIVELSDQFFTDPHTFDKPMPSQPGILGLALASVGMWLAPAPSFKEV